MFDYKKPARTIVGKRPAKFVQVINNKYYPLLFLVSCTSGDYPYIYTAEGNLFLLKENHSDFDLENIPEGGE